MKNCAIKLIVGPPDTAFRRYYCRTHDCTWANYDGDGEPPTFCPEAWKVRPAPSPPEDNHE